MRARASFPRAAAAALGLALLVLGLSDPIASAAVTCTFNSGNNTVTVTLTEGATVALARQGDAIAVDGTQCDTATVNNTDTIQVDGSAANADDVTIDLSGGAFAPGADDEQGADDEIEFSVDLPGGGDLRVSGRDVVDRFTVGVNGANLNAGEATGDIDVVLTGAALWSLAGMGEDDHLSVAGGAGTGPAASDVSVSGGTGDDTIEGAIGGCVIDGGGGVDTLDYSASPAGVRVDLSKHEARRDGAEPDTVLEVEDLVGTAQGDQLTGAEGPNELRGLAGADTLDGHRGSDDLFGGDGKDTVAFAYATQSVTVDLKKGTSTGNGDDALDSIENVQGSEQSDVITGDPVANELRGGSGSDAIQGNGGKDLLVGAKGFDSLSGGADGDRLEGGRGKDQLNGGKGRDTCVPGPDPDAWIACEVVKL
ncbi:MAG TPA: hypothetical protein VFT27_14465 [Actinomycetota bacterium]|nr:hypothetical protein [Actinomycetota bacterium]